MPKSVPAALKKLNYQPKIFPQHLPHQHIPIIYGKKGFQQMINDNMSNLLPSKEIKHIQSITGTFFYNTRALYYTMLPVLNEIACTQAKPTEYTKEEC